MAYIKWIKLATCMPDDERMKLIDAMPERDTVHYIWIRLLIQAGRTNSDGEIFLSDDMPYTHKMLATLFSRPLTSIKLALKTLSLLGMIEIASDKIIKIVNWDKHQNIEGMERVREQNRKRAENHREKKKLEKKAAKNNDEEIYGDEALEEDNNDLKESEEMKDNEHLQENNGEKNKSINEKEKAENTKGDEEAFVNSACDKDNTVTNEASSNNIEETSDNNCNATRNISNVTQNKSNVTVTQQNKIENKNKNKNKKEKREIDKDKNKEIDKNIESYKNNICDVNNTSSAYDQKSNHSNFFDYNTKSQAADVDINLKAMELMKYHEKITGIAGGCDAFALRAAINEHGEKRVKMAMDIGFERNCPEIKYAIGVLKNWRRDGYPKDDMEVKKNGVRNFRKSNTEDKNEFAGFKPKEPRKLTDAERKRAEANLI